MLSESPPCTPLSGLTSSKVNLKFIAWIYSNKFWNNSLIVLIYFKSPPDISDSYFNMICQEIHQNLITQ